MGIMITYHEYNTPVYNMHKNVGAHYTRQNTVGKVVIVSLFTQMLGLATFFLSFQVTGLMMNPSLHNPEECKLFHSCHLENGS